MASQKVLRRVLLLTGAFCLVFAFLPYYSKTVEPMAGIPNVDIDLPVLGNLNLQNESTRTFIRVGLPLSPWFTYVKSLGYPQAPTITAVQPGDSTAHPGVTIHTPGPGVATVTTFNFDYKYDWHLSFFCWSAALALLGVALLVLGWRRAGGKPAPLSLI